MNNDNHLQIKSNHFRGAPKPLPNAGAAAKEDSPAAQLDPGDASAPNPPEEACAADAVGEVCFAKPDVVFAKAAFSLVVSLRAAGWVSRVGPDPTAEDWPNAMPKVCFLRGGGVREGCGGERVKRE